MTGPRLPDCDTCDDEREVPCYDCDGSGQILLDDGILYDCAECDGSGLVTCPACREEGEDV